MSTTKRIACLANSRKLSGRCIAGREIDGNTVGPWVRPVSDRTSQEVSEHERQYEDGRDPRVLDVIEIPLLKPCPTGYQSENWQLDPDGYWKQTGRLSMPDLASLVDPIEPLWLDGASTYHGLNDKISVEGVKTIDSSLRLIQVPQVQVRVFVPGIAFGNDKRRVQAGFDHADVPYRLWITDPVCERRFLEQPNGEYELGGSYLTVSIGEPLEGYVYKLVAAVIEEEGT